jgi:NAD(P)-dependent dehydrogenase (short-subunit alcohol dehydrogenase family)
MTDHTDRIDPDLSGQVALVTGGGRGIGRACALALAAAGAIVAVVARTASELAETVTKARAAGGAAFSFPTDVGEPAAVRELMEAVQQQLGPVDLLVNNAGISTPLGPLWEVDPEGWWRCLEVNLRGPMLCSRLLLSDMVARRRGRIINVASGAGTVAIPYLSAYVVSKAALIRLTECLAREGREFGIRVFAIQPGTVRTTMAELVLTSDAGRKWLPWFKDYFDQRQDVPPTVAAQLVLFLASGRGDVLSGRFLDACTDYERLVGQVEEVESEDLLVLRLRGVR